MILITGADRSHVLLDTNRMSQFATTLLTPVNECTMFTKDAGKDFLVAPTLERISNPHYVHEGLYYCMQVVLCLLHCVLLSG